MDPKFVAWVQSVSPDPGTANKILTSIDWTTIVTILLQIFEALLAAGCFAAMRTRYQVRSVLKNGPNTGTESQLKGILQNVTSK